MSRHASATTRSLPRRLLLGGLILAAITALVGMAWTWPRGGYPEISDAFVHSQYNQKLIDGTVISVDSDACQSPSVGQVFDGSPVFPVDDTSADQDCRRSVVEITSGEHAGRNTMFVHYNVPGEPVLEPGDKIRMTSGDQLAFADYARGPSLLWWGLAVVLGLIIFAGWRGVRALAGLGITLAFILGYLLPAVATGVSSSLLAVITGAVILLAVVPLVHGINWKSAAALAGTLLALLLAAGLTTLGLSSTGVRGLGSEDMLNIMLYLPEVSVMGLLSAGFIIGTLGVLNDVTIAQASTINELADLDPEATPWRLFTGAMRVGQDHITSVVYTLVLSYTGAALPRLLLISAADRSLFDTLTSDVVATELLRSIIGALALILAVPLTTFVAAWTVPEKSDTHRLELAQRPPQQRVPHSH